MCGIAGVLSEDRAAVEPAVRRMMRAMVHRGPDDDGFEQFPLAAPDAGAAVGFGFRRLAILDLSPSGHQPMVNRDTGDALIFNGEIYNYGDLRRRLEAQGRRFRSSGDTEVLLQALGAWGERALDELDGMFALAFFQAATRRVLLARDPLGIKPLYVARSTGMVVFASEVRAVLASGLVADDLDPAGIAGFFAFGSPQDPLTVHARVQSLPAATAEWCDAGTLAGMPPRRRAYWRMPDTLAEAPPNAAAVARVREELAASVRRQCVADVPLGVFLSGGIDSATMAALARDDRGPPATFAVGYEIPGVADETGAATDTARALGTTHYQTVVDDDWAIMQWSEWLKAADRPSIDGLNTYIVSGAVKDRGITVALSGLGADELFCGYSSFRRVRRLWRALACVAWLPPALRRSVAGMAAGVLPARFRSKGIDLLAAGSSIVDVAILSRRLLGDEAMNRLGFDARSLGLAPSFLPTEAHTALAAGAGDHCRAISVVESLLYMGNTLLRDSDVNGMAHSLEIRVPFLGRGVVDYVASLPQSVRQPRGSLPKHLLRRGMADQLPAAVFSRPKQGFALPFGQWLYGPLRERCEAAVDSLAAVPLVDGAEVRRIWAAGSRGLHWSRPLALVVLGDYLHKRAEARRSFAV